MTAVSMNGFQVRNCVLVKLVYGVRKGVRDMVSPELTAIGHAGGAHKVALSRF